MTVLFCASLNIIDYCFSTVSADSAETELNKFDYNLYILIDTHELNGKWVACFISPDEKKVFGMVSDSVGKTPNQVNIVYINQFQIIVDQLFLLNREQWIQRVFAWNIYEKYRENCWK